MRKIFIILVCCTVALLGGYAGYRGYKVWRQNHMLKLAHEYLAKSDTRNALLCVTQVLRANSRQVEACRMMADLTQASRSPSAMLWRSRVVELNPHSLDDRLALAQTALLFRDYATATNALEGVDPAAKATYVYHNVAGAVCVTINRLAEAEAHFLEAARLEPANPVPQLNLAVVRLHGSNALDMAEARIILQRIVANPTNATMCCKALRELVLDAAHNNNLDAALALSRQLVQDTNSLFSDRILQLDLLRRLQHPEFTPALAACQGDATNDLAKIYELTLWQMSRSSPREALAWLQSLPLNTQTNQTVSLLATECRMMFHDWPGLQASLQKQNWAELEFLRQATLAYALRNQDLVTAAKAAWGQALQTASDRKGSQIMLLRLAAQWNWQSEAEELLWNIVNLYPGERWAIQSLNRVLITTGRTRSLMMLYGQQLKASPADLGIKNNLAMTALLLDAQELRPHELAREVYDKAPTNAACVSTYAFSLYLQKKNNEALKVMETLNPQQLQDPSVAGYYGIILKASGNDSRAIPYLDLAFKSFLLPEEKKLFQQAKAGA